MAWLVLKYTNALSLPVLSFAWMAPKYLTVRRYWKVETIKDMERKGGIICNMVEKEERKEKNKKQQCACHGDTDTFVVGTVH